MSSEPTKKDGEKSRQSITGAGIALGVGVGLAIGNAMDNVGAGLAIGLAIGIAAGAGMQPKKNNGKDSDPSDHDA